MTTWVALGGRTLALARAMQASPLPTPHRPCPYAIGHDHSKQPTSKRSGHHSTTVPTIMTQIVVEALSPVILFLLSP